MSALIRKRVLALLESAGVHPGGGEATDPRIHDERFYARVLSQGSLGLGESYMEGWWDVDSLDGLLTRLVGARLDQRVQGWASRLDDLRAWLLNLQTARRARVVGKRHYDIGNDLFHRMLGRRMVYSCGYWREARDLDAAQEAKLDLVCRKLGLRPGMRVLDIGCGWGEALQYAAQRYGVSGVGVTISQAQAEYARRLCDGLPIDIRLQDYREVDE
ncbi:MAG TPA: class I SAM-dependent methyltransferase, partial [Luteimonas sp.]|nr:class I SAM-dependent methyltransferase [Luteimonas sp.]